MKKNGIGVSLVYKFSEKVLVKLIGFVISVILARIIAPEVFGIVAIISAIVALAQVFIDSGLSTALVQNKVATDDDFSTIFYISIGLAIVVYIVLFFLTPVITHFYKIEGYETAIRILSCTLFFYAMNSIQGAKLQRDMRFKSILVCQTITVVLSGLTGILLAYFGFGIWALILYYLCNSVLSCITNSFVVDWHPRLVFSITRAKELLNYGYKIFLSGILCSLFSNIRTFVIGKLYTNAQLGLYSRADQIPSIISTSIDSTFNAVMLPAFSKKQDDYHCIKELLRKTISLNSSIIMPAMFGLFAVANNLVLSIYTEKWISCVPILKVLSLANLTVAIFPSCLSAIKAVGKSEINLKLEIVRRLVMIVILVVSLFFRSLLAIAIGWMFSTVVDVFIVMVPTRRLFCYTMSELMKDTCFPFSLSILMAFCVWCIGKLPFSPIALLPIQIIAGVLFYVGGFALIKPHELKEVIKHLHNK